MKMLLQIIQDDKRNISSLRIVMVLTIIFFFGNWIYSLIVSGSFNPSWELVVFAIFIITGKVVQKFGEGSSDAM